MANPGELDFRGGISVDKIADGAMIQGKAGGEDVVLVRRKEELFAVGANCTHYGGPLAKGLLLGEELRCPWHHACFNIRTGEALRAPALDAIACWRVERVGANVFVREKLPVATAKTVGASSQRPASVVIVGGGAAGLAAADMLRREGYDGPVTILSADPSGPVDRPNLSKDYLAGTASEDWIPLRPADFYAQKKIELVLNTRVTAIDARQKQLRTENDKTYDFGALLLATGAEPVKLPLKGASESQVYYLRTFADSRTLVQRAEGAKQVVVVGASFIGLEVAASLRARGVGVHVVAPDKQPLERVMGTQVGAFIRELHESHGVVFHLGETVNEVNGRTVRLSGGQTADADFIVLGVGVRPALSLAESAGLAIDRGVTVNEYLETSAPRIFAAGDIARWPDSHTGERIRVEHWVVAERQGQTAARNILGYRERFDAVPFFWSQHYDVQINYVGHAENWDAVEIEGKLEERNCAVTYKRQGRTLAVATIGQDLKSLQAEASMEGASLRP